MLDPRITEFAQTLLHGEDDDDHDHGETVIEGITHERELNSLIIELVKLFAKENGFRVVSPRYQGIVSESHVLLSEWMVGVPYEHTFLDRVKKHLDQKFYGSISQLKLKKIKTRKIPVPDEPEFENGPAFSFYIRGNMSFTGFPTQEFRMHITLYFFRKMSTNQYNVSTMINVLNPAEVGEYINTVKTQSRKRSRKVPVIMCHGSFGSRQ